MTDKIIRGVVCARADANKTVEDLDKAIKAFTKDFDTANNNVLDKIKALTEASDKGQSTADAALQAATKAVDEVKATALELQALQQELGSVVNNQNELPQSMGEFVVSQDKWKQFAEMGGEDSKVRITVQANTITGQDGSPPENSNVLVQEQRRPGITPGAFTAMRIKSLLTSIPISSNSYQFMRELSFTNNAAEVAEGTAKPESDITFELQEVNVRTIAHWLKLSTQILSDAPLVAAYVDTRLRYGVDLREDRQLLNGDGTGQNISGMTNSGNYVAYTPVTGDTKLDTINRAKYQVINNDYNPEAVILNPTDWGAIERLKTSTGEYVIGDAFGTITPILWGLMVVPTNAMTAGKFHMAAYSQTFDYLDRQQTVIELAYSGDDFTNNLVTMRGEKRSALATRLPATTRYGDLEI